MKGKKKGGREGKGGREKREWMKGEREGRRKRKDDVIPNFSNLEALQLQTWGAVALVFSFMQIRGAVFLGGRVKLELLAPIPFIRAAEMVTW